jgi:hypothetical protein
MAAANIRISQAKMKMSSSASMKWRGVVSIIGVAKWRRGEMAKAYRRNQYQQYQ